MTTSSRRTFLLNLDFYSAITLKALGFPTEMFTVLYAIARTAGWIAHWKEMIDDPSQRIGRPRQLYTGPHRAHLRADGSSIVRPDFSCELLLGAAALVLAVLHFLRYIIEMLVVNGNKSTQSLGLPRRPKLGASGGMHVIIMVRRTL